MGEASVVDLIVRMLVSLGVVMALIAGAFVVARRRLGGSSRAMRLGSSRRSRRSAPPAIEVVGRAGLSRGSIAVALRFGGSVVLVAVSEQGPSTVLQTIDEERFDALHAPQEPEPPAEGSAAPSIIGPQPTFLDALRDATTRRA